LLDVCILADVMIESVNENPYMTESIISRDGGARNARTAQFRPPALSRARKRPARRWPGGWAAWRRVTAGWRVDVPVRSIRRLLPSATDTI
jgi:hypothetical protein